jgi:indolepyruvate ferredoxin oxidoreductase beta subunit
VLLSFELIETVRYWPFLAANGKVIINDLKILPPAVFTGQMQYPTDVIEKVKERVPDTIVIDAQAVADKLGNPRGVNIILLGMMSKYLDIPVADYEAVMKEKLKPKLVDINLKAFHEGRSLAGA